MNSPNFKLKLADFESTDFLPPLGDGLVGIVYSIGYCDRLVVVDIHTGRVLWEKEGYEILGMGVAVPVYDGEVIYAPFKCNPESGSATCTQPICAYDTAGRQLWVRPIGEGKHRFVTPLALTATHIGLIAEPDDAASFNLRMINRATGEVDCVVELAHEHCYYDHWLLAWGDRFVVATIDRDEQFWFDIYDPTTGFVSSVPGYPDSGGKDDCIARRAIVIVGDEVCFFTDMGKFYRLNLATGEREVHFVVEGVYDLFYYSDTIMRCGDVLYCVAQREDGARLCTYDLAAGKFRSEPLKMDNTVVQLWGGNAFQLSDNGVVRYKLTGEPMEIALQEWSGDILSEALYGRSWIVVDGKLLVVCKTGEVFCWDV